MSKHQLAIFVSGTGSNARVMIDYFAPNPEIEIALLVSNKPDAKALKMATEKGVPSLVLDRKAFRETDQLLAVLAEFEITFIVLAGFLWLIPPYLVKAFPQRIVNIHPALLPKYGGKGMYGMNVHRAVKAADESESGITIHFVNERYDEGNIIFQTTTALKKEDTAEVIAQKVLRLEHQNYSPVVQEILSVTD